MFNWRTSLWLLLSTVLIPALLALSVGILILVFYRQPWDVAFGVLVLCFAVFAVTGSSITVFLLRRSARLAQAQTEFIANISHEFRTPLTSIRMFVETLRSGKIVDDEAQQRCLDVLSRETERMERMVARVLTFRQLERPFTSTALAVHTAEPLVRQALAPWTAVDDEKASRVELVVEPDLPRLLADPDTLMEAVRNLVANALKFSTGPVVVTVRHDGEAVAVSVRDHGPAIPRREQKRVFRRFYRGTTDKPGSGLGLAIAHRAAQAHGGTLDLRSTPRLGNVFTLRLPLVEVGPPMGEPDGASNPGGEKTLQ